MEFKLEGYKGNQIKYKLNIVIGLTFQVLDSLQKNHSFKDQKFNNFSLHIHNVYSYYDFWDLKLIIIGTGVEIYRFKHTCLNAIIKKKSTTPHINAGVVNI